MNKADLILHIADKAGVSKKQSEDMIEALTGIVTETLKKGEEVTIVGFGSFESMTRKPRMGVDPRNPSKPMEIHAVTVPKFRAGSALKKALKEKNQTAVSPQPAVTSSATSSS